MAQFTSDAVDDGMIIMLREHRVFREQRALQYNVFQSQYVYAYEGMFLVAEDTYHELFCQLLYLATTDKLASDFKDFFERMKEFTEVVRTSSAAVYTNAELEDMV